MPATAVRRGRATGLVRGALALSAATTGGAAEAGQPHAGIEKAYLIRTDGQETTQRVIEMLVRLMRRPRDAQDQMVERPAHDFRYTIDAGRLDFTCAAVG